MPVASPGPVDPGSVSKMAPGGSSAVLPGGLSAVAATLLLGAAAPYAGHELLTAEETAVPRSPSCPGTGSVYGQAAAVDGEPALGVRPAGEDEKNGDGNLLPLRVSLNFTVAELAVPSMGGGGGLSPFPCTLAGSARNSQPGLAPATALVLNSSGRASRKGALTVAAPLSSEAAVRMDAPGQAVVAANGTDPVEDFFPILPPLRRPPPEPPPFQLSVEKVEGEVLGKVK